MGKIEIFENQRAQGYNKFVQTWIPNYDYFMDIVPRLLDGIPHKNLLVAGCGTGNEIERLVQASSEWQITGVDPSPEMIAQASLKLRKYTNVKLVEGLVNDLDKKKRYGAATLLLVLHFMEDDGAKLNLLQSISERLESQSPFIMLDITGTKLQLRENLEVLRHLVSTDLSKEEIDSRLQRIENKLFPVSEIRVTELLMEAGFERPVRFFQTSIYMGWMAYKK